MVKPGTFGEPVTATTNRVGGTKIGRQGDDVDRTYEPAAVTAGTGGVVSDTQGGKTKAGLKDRQQLCIDLLMEGCVHSFIDFFYILHRKSEEVASSTDTTTTTTQQSHGGVAPPIPREAMEELKDKLEAAEVDRRNNKFFSCIEHYKALAKYFTNANDLKSAMYFNERCIDVAVQMGDKKSITQANFDLGDGEISQGNWESARTYLTAALADAQELEDNSLVHKTAEKLVHVYKTLAQQHEKDPDCAEIVEQFYDKCLESAVLSRKQDLQGLAHYNLGKAKHNLAKYEDAIEQQHLYISICQDLQDKLGAAHARAALAQAYEACGKRDEAIKTLEQLLNVDSEAVPLGVQSLACLHLGLLRTDQEEAKSGAAGDSSGAGGGEKSVELLEQHFDLARQLGDRRLIDSARVILGMARGHGKLTSFLDVVAHDGDKLLKWKAKRVPF